MRTSIGDNNYIFYPEIKDREEAGRLLDAAMIQVLKRANFPPEYIYAWHKCGFFHPDIVNAFRKHVFGSDPLPSRLSDEEIKQWDEAVKEYREKGGKIPGF